VTRLTRRAIILCGLAGLAGCGAAPSRFRTYDGPEVTQLLLFKERRVMHLLHNDQVLRSYTFELGFAPTGPKRVEGDGRTPEGTYLINRRNPNSQYHLSLGISYPDTRDVELARALGLPPGGEIFIHGTPRRNLGQRDWTAGCIAVTNDEIEEIYAMVRDNTPIIILP